MGPLGFNEIVILLIVLVLFIIVPVIVAYRLGIQKGRLIELDRQRKEQI
jgi:hypothetical protein